MKKRFALMMAAVMVLSLTACGSKPSGGGTGDAADAEVSGEEDTGGSQETRSIRVGTLPFAGSVPVAYALEQGYFTDAGLDVEQYEFATGAPMNEAFAAGQLDVAVIGLAGVISMSTGNAVCIYETNVASGGNGIFVREDSPLASEEITADALKGMNFIGQLATSSQLMVIRFLEKYGLSQDDVNFINMDSGADYQAFKSGEGDAVALMTPYAWNAEDEGYVCIYDFAEESDYVVPDTMLATVSCMEKDRDTVKGFLEVYLKALDSYRIEREDKAGVGYVDFIFYPFIKSDDAIIIELKVNHTPEEAIQQIRDRQYALRFEGKFGEHPEYTGRVLAVGIAYSKKDEQNRHACKVEVLRGRLG